MKPKFQKILLLAVVMGVSTAFNLHAGNNNAIKPYINEVMNRQPITAVEKESLLFMREEEKLARDVYTMLYDKWSIQIFSNIGESEQRHMDAILQLLTQYNVPDPVGSNDVGVFTNTKLQKLYNELIAQGLTSLTNALKVGATIEDLDIFDLKTALAQIENQDIRTVYGNLKRASGNHLRAFNSNLVSRGEEYIPQYISQTEFDSIINSPMEKGSGGQHMKHKN